jgi:hypothetical protein
MQANVAQQPDYMHSLWDRVTAMQAMLACNFSCDIPLHSLRFKKIKTVLSLFNYTVDACGTLG